MERRLLTHNETAHTRTRVARTVKTGWCRECFADPALSDLGLGKLVTCEVSRIPISIS